MRASSVLTASALSPSAFLVVLQRRLGTCLMLGALLGGVSTGCTLITDVDREDIPEPETPTFPEVDAGPIPEPSGPDASAPETPDASAPDAGDADPADAGPDASAPPADAGDAG